jgi:hypothetical protein
MGLVFVLFAVSVIYCMDWRIGDSFLDISGRLRVAISVDSRPRPTSNGQQC